MIIHTIEAYRVAPSEWHTLTFDGLPAPSMWLQARQRAQFNLRGHSFSIYAPHDWFSFEDARRMVDHFFAPSTARQMVDLSIFNVAPSRRGGAKK